LKFWFLNMYSFALPPVYDQKSNLQNQRSERIDQPGIQKAH
jgi:hypothetical protein